MTKKLLLAAPILMLSFYGTTRLTAQPSCAPIDTPPVCQNTNQININNSGNSMGPPHICVDPGETITVNVSPSGTTASVMGKDGGWPNGSGAGFTITAPASGSYDYNVIFSDGSCVDPRITVGR